VSFEVVKVNESSRKNHFLFSTHVRTFLTEISICPTQSNFDHSRHTIDMEVKTTTVEEESIIIMAGND